MNPDDVWLCRPRPFVRGKLDLLRHTVTIHTMVREISKLKFSKEFQRQTRILLRARAGLPLDPLDAMPINWSLN